MNIKQDRWDAQHYKKHSKGQYQKGISAIKNLHLQGNEYVLDIGCGDGRITTEIAQQVPNGHVLGIDISENMINEAKKSFGDIHNLEFQCDDAIAFTHNNKFDVIVSFSTFHWIKDQLSALKNIYQILKPDGQLHITASTPHKSPICSVYEREKWQKLLHLKEKSYFPKTVEDFTNMLEKCGFKHIDVTIDVSSRLFANKKELFNWAYAWVPHSTGFAEDKAKEFAHDIVKSIATANKPGELILETRHLDVWAKKG